MKTILRNIVCLSLLIAACLPARALTIVRINSANMSNTAIISASDAAAAAAAFDYAAAQVMAMYNDPVQINITLNPVAGTSTLGGSNTPLFGPYTYAQVKAALIADGTTGDDATFNATLPGSDPTGADRFFIARAMQKALGLRASDAVNDGTFSFGTGFSYTYDPNNRLVPGKFDFVGIAFHEITEIMGRIPGLGNTFGTGSASYLPYDLHRFSGSGVRGLSGGPGEYYSINNGVTNGKDFNDGGNGGDSQDWLGLDNDAYNAFTSSGVMNPWTGVDLQVMDVIGYNSVGCIGPSFTACPGNQSANTVLNGCTAVVSYTATASGNPGPYLTYAFTGATTGSGAGTGSGSTFNKGVTNVAITASSGCGTATCSFTVTVNDNQAPSVSCPGNITAYTGPGRTTCDQAVSWATGASDNCGSVTVTSSHASGSTFPVGTTTVTVTATDGSTNTNSCTFDVTVIDNTPPDAQCKPVTIHLSGGTASITPSDVDNSSTDNCGIVTRSVSPNTFGCSQIGGTYPVVLTLTDAASNTSNCTAQVTVAGTPVSCSVSVASCAPAVCTNAPVTTIFLGYGPQCATATANATGGDGGGYTYSWSPSTNLSCNTCQSPVFTPTVAGCYTYTVTVTNVNSGCSSTCSVTFCVKDIRVPGQPGKVYVCHIPPDNPSAPNTISVSVNSVPVHVCGHGGDRLGKCDDPCVCAPVAKMANPGSGSSTNGLNVVAYPNPFRNVINVRFEGAPADQAVIRVYDATGRVLETREDQHAGVEIPVGEKLAPGIYTVEVKQGNTSQKIRVVKY